MNGAESLVRTLVGGGVNVCFANPGTSEMHFVAALDRVDGMRCVLGLFEGVVTGAADGYARMTGNPAATLLHLGPGIANLLANIHNANKVSSGMVNIVGDHATYHRRRAHAAGTDRDPDPAGGHGVERGLRPCRGAARPGVARGIRCVRLAHFNSSITAFAALRSAVSNPSVKWR
jgi:Thiamine pyrophosphate enzyme, N-terminal TPP binding domain